MYLIPKNIKTKKEIFKGLGIAEVITISISLVIGYLLQSFISGIKLKIFFFFLFPLICVLLFLPLPNGSTTLTIFKKFIKYNKNQKKYKKYL